MRKMTEKVIERLVKKALALHGKPFDPEVDPYYSRDEGYNYSYHRLAYLAARYMNPEIIVELGTQYACCTAHFAAGAPKARVVTIDCIDVFRQELFFREIPDKFPNIEFAIANSTGFDIVNSFDPESIGIVYADSLHTEKHVMHEIETWTPKMKDGALWLIDDLRLMPELFDMLPFRVKRIVPGLHQETTWPDQQFCYAIVERE